MVSIIKITLINGDVRELSTDGLIDYEEMINKGAATYQSKGVQVLIPLTSILTFEVTKQE